MLLRLLTVLVLVRWTVAGTCDLSTARVSRDIPHSMYKGFSYGLNWTAVCQNDGYYELKLYQKGTDSTDFSTGMSIASGQGNPGYWLWDVPDNLAADQYTIRLWLNNDYSYSSNLTIEDNPQVTTFMASQAAQSTMSSSLIPDDSTTNARTTAVKASSAATEVSTPMSTTTKPGTTGRTSSPPMTSATAFSLITSVGKSSSGPSNDSIPSTEDGKSGRGRGAIAGIVMGSVAGCALLAAVLSLLMLCRRGSRQSLHSEVSQPESSRFLPEKLHVGAELPPEPTSNPQLTSSRIYELATPDLGPSPRTDGMTGQETQHEYSDISTARVAELEEHGSTVGRLGIYHAAGFAFHTSEEANRNDTAMI